jgi:hypothetical protein
MAAVAEKTPTMTRTPFRERLRITGRVARWMTQARIMLAKAISVVTGLCALVLVAGALLVALGGNEANHLVEFVKQAATQIDFGVFDRRNGVFDFEGKNAGTKNAVVNWGLAAVVWLVLGRIVSGAIHK